MTYDKLYAKGGFKYSSKVWLPRIKSLVNDLQMEGNILDAPAGDGFWSRLLRAAIKERIKDQPNKFCNVVATDLSVVGCQKANGIVWNLNIFNPEWENKFDWVFSRGISHLHHQHIDTTPFQHMSRYAKNIIVIYSTTLTNKQSKSGVHFNHTVKNLNEAMEVFREPSLYKCYSFMNMGYYHFVRIAKQ